MHTQKVCLVIAVSVISVIIPVSAQSNDSREIWFGTTLNADSVVSRAQELAKILANPSSVEWKAKGDLKRVYRFPDANAEEPYRLYVPDNWDGMSKLPLVMFLHGAGSNESTYLDADNKKMIHLAAKHRFLLVSPVGDQGAYGNFLRLTAPFGDSVNAAKLMSQVTSASERINQLSEQDVINVLELLLSEYPIDRNAMFLTGHSMGSGGTWIIGGKYHQYWRAIAPMSGPFVQKSGYPWEHVREKPVFITEGVKTPSLDASRALRDWMTMHKMTLKYKEVNADHGGMVPLVLPDVFDFFDSCRSAPVSVNDQRGLSNAMRSRGVYVHYQLPKTLRISFLRHFGVNNMNITIANLLGKTVWYGQGQIENGQVVLRNIYCRRVKSEYFCCITYFPSFRVPPSAFGTFPR
ncbi:MAG: hypothetical protein JW915_08055 [Chitinispirillaceae bacterium]|nr:hypothetical protein [Chitinispirillaceae bacterium]